MVFLTKPILIFQYHILFHFFFHDYTEDSFILLFLDPSIPRSLYSMIHDLPPKNNLLRVCVIYPTTIQVFKVLLHVLDKEMEQTQFLAFEETIRKKISQYLRRLSRSGDRVASVPHRSHFEL